MNETSLDSLLSATALLTTIIALLFSLWYGEIKEAIDTQPPRHREDAIDVIAKLRRVRLGRATPILLAAVGNVLVFFPPAARLGEASLASILSGPSLDRYDAIVAAFLAVYVACLGLAWLSLHQWLSLTAKLSALRSLPRAADTSH